MVIPVLKIRRSQGRLIFNMGIPIPVRRHLYIETTLWIRHHIIIMVDYGTDFEVKRIPVSASCTIPVCMRWGGGERQKL